MPFRAVLSILLFIFKDRRIERLKRDYALEDMFPVLYEDVRDFIEQRNKYEYLHVELKSPLKVIDSLKQEGFRIKNTRMTRGYTILQNLPFPVSIFFGKVFTVVAKKKSL